MKYYIYDSEGKLVEATLEDSMNVDVKLYNEEGEEIDRAQKKVDDDVVPDEDALDKFGDTLGKMSETVSEMSGEIVSLKKKLKENDIKAQQALPIPDDADIKVVDDGDVMKFIGGQYDINRQGLRLMDDKVHTYHPKPEALKEMTKYFCLVATAYKGFGSPESLKAIEYLRKIYGKTVVGDTGNTFPIPDIVDEEILHFARESSLILQYARMWDMVSEKQSFPQESSAVSVGWGNTTSESEPGVSEVELDAEELSAYSAVRNTTLADSRSDIVSWLGEALSEAAGLELDNKGFNGVGTDSPFICSGILSAACGYSVSLASGSTAFSQLSATKLSEMISKLDGLKKSGAMFWLHGSNLHFVRDLKDDNNRPIFIETVGAPMSGTIWGYPYRESIKCPSTSAVSTAYVAFGNMKYFMVGRRLNVSALDVDPYGLWTTNRTRFKLYQRWALIMGLPNGFVRLLTAAS
jgi:HK97 family phage major capsid protein